MTTAERIWEALLDDPVFVEGMAKAQGQPYTTFFGRRHGAESGAVSGKDGRVYWRMTADEAEEIADYLERSSLPQDVARVDVKALRRAVKDARS